MRKVATFMGLIGCVCLIQGCPGTTPNPAEVLAGTWQLTFDEPGDLEGFDIQLTFDADGQLTEINAEGPEGGTASLEVDNASTDVDGDEVTITIPAEGGNRIISGTLSEDENTITGELSAELELPAGDLEVTLPGSGLTLERLPE